MASPTIPDGAVTYEPFTLPDEGYKASLLGLLAVQAAPMWSVGQQAAYQEHVMAGPTLEHWVRISGVWAEVERNIWELNGLLGHLEVAAWEDLPGAGQMAGTVAEALESWVDLLLVELVVDDLGAAMARASQTSSYAPLARTARLLAFGKSGSQASGVVGLREALTEGQAPRSQVEERSAVWLEVADTMAAHYDAAQQAGDWASRGLMAPIEAAALLTDTKAALTGLLEVPS